MSNTYISNDLGYFASRSRPNKRYLTPSENLIANKIQRVNQWNRKSQLQITSIQDTVEPRTDLQIEDTWYLNPHRFTNEPFEFAEFDLGTSSTKVKQFMMEHDRDKYEHAEPDIGFTFDFTFCPGDDLPIMELNAEEQKIPDKYGKQLILAYRKFARFNPQGNVNSLEIPTYDPYGLLTVLTKQAISLSRFLADQIFRDEYLLAEFDDNPPTKGVDMITRMSNLGKKLIAYGSKGTSIAQILDDISNALNQHGRDCDHAALYFILLTIPLPGFTSDRSRYTQFTTQLVGLFREQRRRYCAAEGGIDPEQKDEKQAEIAEKRLRGNYGGNGFFGNVGAAIREGFRTGFNEQKAADVGRRDELRRVDAMRGLLHGEGRDIAQARMAEGEEKESDLSEHDAFVKLFTDFSSLRQAYGAGLISATEMMTSLVTSSAATMSAKIGAGAYNITSGKLLKGIAYSALGVAKYATGIGLIGAGVLRGIDAGIGAILTADPGQSKIIKAIQTTVSTFVASGQTPASQAINLLDGRIDLAGQAVKSSRAIVERYSGFTGFFNVLWDGVKGALPEKRYWEIVEELHANEAQLAVLKAAKGQASLALAEEITKDSTLVATATANNVSGFMATAGNYISKLFNGVEVVKNEIVRLAGSGFVDPDTAKFGLQFTPVGMLSGAALLALVANPRRKENMFIAPAAIPAINSMASYFTDLYIQAYPQAYMTKMGLETAMSVSGALATPVAGAGVAIGLGAYFLYRINTARKALGVPAPGLGL